MYKRNVGLYWGMSGFVRGMYGMCREYLGCCKGHGARGIHLVGKGIVSYL